MKTFKRTLAVLCAALMMTAAFTSCTSNEETKTDSTQPTTAVSTVAETEAETSANASYVGEYFYDGPETDVTISVSDDNTFEMTTTGDNFKSVVSGGHKFGVTDSASKIKLILAPHKSVTEADGETTVDDDMSDIDPSYATIEGDKLTLEADGKTTVFTKK